MKRMGGLDTLINEAIMDPIVPFDWYRLFIGTEPPLYLLEIIFRVVFIYSFAVFALRYMGKRGQRQLSPFELVLVIALGSATGDSMLYPEVPILYAWLIILAMVALDRLLSALQFRYRSINTFLEGQPSLMVREGKILEKSLNREKLRREELMALLREQEVSHTGEIQYAFLEQTGKLGLFRHATAEYLRGESTYPESFEE
jgi:uncharacterized membrane protein YcaP (DUF421 family)